MATTYAIPNGRTVMDATTYTGTGAALTVSNADLGTTGFKPDLVWIKTTNNVSSHALIDSVRGISGVLNSNLQNGQSNSTAGTGLNSFNSNGFTLGTENSATGSTNVSAYNYVAWQWQAGQGVTSSNTSGTITSTVSVNATAGFSVVTYSGTSANATVGHGLGVAPQFIMIKGRTFGADWINYTSSTGANNVLFINAVDGSTAAPTAWNNTAPTSSVFSLGSLYNVNRTGDNYVAYCWAPVAGFSQFNYYTGNGSADGPFVYTGFRPKFILSSTSNWRILDTSRDLYNVEQYGIFPNTNAAQETFSAVDGLSNGFKIRNSDGAYNGSGTNYTYMAFAENPFKYANAR
jgi:hypothetical protein